MGRPSVFEGKDRSSKLVKGLMTPAGWLAFELARVDLGKLYAAVMGSTIKGVSDGDTVEYLARGHRATKAYLRRKDRSCMRRQRESRS